MNLRADKPRTSIEEGNAASFVILPGDPAAGLILICDHASNRVPAEYDDLGLPAAELRRHIAYDIGAARVTVGLAERLGVPAVLSNFSRLLIDPNRGEDDPTLIMRLSDGMLIPANADIDTAERARRVAHFHAPYHDAVAATIERGFASGCVPALISLHSFTPAWRGRPRPWQAGILWDRDPRLALPMLALLAADPSRMTIGDNEPYAGARVNDTLYRHGTRRGLAHVLIEIRQDLIAGETGAAEWVERLAPMIDQLNGDDEVHVIRHYGSKTGTVSPI